MLPFLINQQYYNSLKYIFKFYTHYIIKQAIKGFCLGKLQSDKKRKQDHRIEAFHLLDEVSCVADRKGTNDDRNDYP